MSKPGLRFIDDPVPACRVCGSTDVTKASFHVDFKNSLASRRYTCRKCGTTFTAGKGRHMKIPDYVVKLCIGLSKKGMMHEDVAPLVTEATEIQVKEATIGQWRKKFEPGYKPHIGKRADPANAGTAYYKPTRKGADKATVRGIRSLMKQIDGKLQTFEKRAERFP